MSLNPGKMIKSRAILVFNNTNIDLARASHATLDVSLSSALTSFVEPVWEMRLKSFPSSQISFQACLDPCYMHPLLLQWPTIRALLSQIIYYFDAMITVLKVRSDFNLFSWKSLIISHCLQVKGHILYETNVCIIPTLDSVTSH